MSVPHIDTRVLDGKRVVLFGHLPPSQPNSSKTVHCGSDEFHHHL
ncbi:hypothetical protein ACVXG9_08885 [Escherichia coli]